MAAHAMILAAGLGTRLRPLTDLLPKPLVPIGDRPLLDHVAARLRAAGLHEIVVNAHHLGDRLADHARRAEGPLRVVHEPRILGTAGGVAGARALLEAPVVVVNGDILVDAPLGELLGAAAAGGLHLAVSPCPAGEGTVGLGAGGRVVRLRGERFGEEIEGGDYVGVAALGADVLAALPAEGCLIGDVALPRLRAGDDVRTLPVSGGFRDVGSPRGYLDACLDWLDRTRGGKSFAPRSVEVERGARLRRVVAGEGARVTGFGTVEDSVLWPGASVKAPAARVIALPDGVVIEVG